MDHAFQERPGFREEPSIQVAAALVVGLGRQLEFGLCEFVQRARVGVDHVSDTLEVLMRNAGVSRAPCQNGGVYGVLADHDRAAAGKQAPRSAYSPRLYQRLDQPILDVRHRVLRSLRPRIHQRFAQRLHRIADPTAHLTPVRLLLQVERREVFQVIQTVADLIHESAAEGAFLLHVSGPIGGELNNLDLRSAKPLGRSPRCP